MTFCLAEASNTNSVDYVGTYAWEKKSPSNLKATFTPVVNSNNVWNVQLEALYQNKVSYYIGYAKGSLTGGFKGEANLKGKKRWWTYDVVSTNGVLYGKHWEKGTQYTGVFVLQVKPSTNINELVKK